MGTLSIPRPTADEAAPFYHGYIAEVTGPDIDQQLIDQLTEVEGLFGSLDDKSALVRYAPGKWSVKEVLGHLTDAERIFGYRLLRVARGDGTPLSGFDENAYVPAGRFDSRSVATLVNDFRSLRESTVALVRGIPAECWSNWGEASGNPVSARALAYIIAGHVRHHLGVLRDRYGLGASAR